MSFALILRKVIKNNRTGHPLFVLNTCQCQIDARVICSVRCDGIEHTRYLLLSLFQPFRLPSGESRPSRLLLCRVPLPVKLKVRIYLTPRRRKSVQWFVYKPLL